MAQPCPDHRMLGARRLRPPPVVGCIKSGGLDRGWCCLLPFHAFVKYDIICGGSAFLVAQQPLFCPFGVQGRCYLCQRKGKRSLRVVVASAGYLQCRDQAAHPTDNQGSSLREAYDCPCRGLTHARELQATRTVQISPVYQSRKLAQIAAVQQRTAATRAMRQAPSSL